MKFLNISFLLVFFITSTSFSVHKFYVSITKIEYAKEEQSLQIINKLFIDDIEDVLQERYNSDLLLGPEGETEMSKELLQKYVLQKLKVSVNGEPQKLQYIGHEYESDVVKSYIEITNISEVTTVEVENKLLTDLFEEQQNIIHVKKEKQRKSVVLDRDNPKGVLNFE